MKEFLTAAVFVATTMGMTSCGGSTESGGADGGNQSKKVRAASSGDDKISTDKEIQRMEHATREAFADRDFPKTRRLVRDGLKLVEKADSGTDLQRAWFLLALGNVEREEGREAEARHKFTDAMAIFHVHKNARGRCETFLAVGQLEARRGDYANAARQYASAEALLPEIKDRSLPGKLKLQTGRLATRQVRHEEARSDFLEAIKAFEAAKDKRSAAETFLLLATEEDALGHGKACHNRLDRALSIFRDIEDLDGQARALHRLAALAERDKKYQRARKLLQKVLSLYEKLERTTSAIAMKQHINALPEKKKKKKK